MMVMTTTTTTTECPSIVLHLEEESFKTEGKYITEKHKIIPHLHSCTKINTSDYYKYSVENEGRREATFALRVWEPSTRGPEPA